ncbi:MAG: preprotein translocase subunit SecE [Rhodobacteraceae bacterium HLUCCO18]|nr:MAG: preprotein translocase subunit SecE [Rhodobacteraceae bacterium HLUCCO18]
MLDRRRAASRGLHTGATLRICPATTRKDTTMANPFQFLQQTRAEIAKVVWPTRREVLVTTAMVFLLAVVFAIFFFGVDWVIRQVLELILTFFAG